MFVSLQKGTYFSKIDLSQAYMQLKLNEESQKRCTISTHKGLFSYCRIPYGISYAPEIFQKVIEQTLQGLEGVTALLDDLLISGLHLQTHFCRLQAVCIDLYSIKRKSVYSKKRQVSVIFR